MVASKGVAQVISMREQLIYKLYTWSNLFIAHLICSYVTKITLALKVRKMV